MNFFIAQLVVAVLGDDLVQGHLGHVQHVAHQAVKGGDAAGEGGAVGQLGHAVLDDGLQAVAPVTEHAGAVGHARAAHGVGNPRRLLRALELVHKFESDALRLGSQLIVYPSQTAFFVKGGVIADEFQSGTHTIKSENIPILGKLLNKVFNDESPFNAEVWFVNQVSILDCKWGTANNIHIENPKYKIIYSFMPRMDFWHTR